MPINTVTIIGANGTLGVGVSAMFASFANTKVYMIARSLEKSQKGIEKAGKSVKANAICNNMIAKTYEDIEQCIGESDLIVETIIENYEKKCEIHKLINKYMKANAISTTVTSSISINKLSKCYNMENRKRFLGMHFFNPPYSLQLCELISSRDTDKNIENELEEYLKQKVYRKVIKTKDEAGFLANRIGFQFINKAMQYAEIYKEQRRH